MHVVYMYNDNGAMHVQTFVNRTWSVKYWNEAFICCCYNIRGVWVKLDTFTCTCTINIVRACLLAKGDLTSSFKSSREFFVMNPLTDSQFLVGWDLSLLHTGAICGFQHVAFNLSLQCVSVFRGAETPFNSLPHVEATFGDFNIGATHRLQTVM